ncbi:unnamed protein product [Rotaria socialis]
MTTVSLITGALIPSASLKKKVIFAMNSVSGDNQGPCLFSIKVNDISCEGIRQNLKPLLTSASANDFECKSELEFLLLRVAYDDLPHMNLYGHTICDAHYNYLTKRFPRTACNVCKTIFNYDSNSKNDLRRITRIIAYGIWQEHQLSVFDETMCGGCPKKLQKKYLTKDIIEESGNILSWLYDDNTYFTPSTISSTGHSVYQSNDDLDLQCDRKHHFKEFLVNNGFQGRVQMTESYGNMLRKSRQNFLRQIKIILLFILQILAPNDFNQVWEDLIEFHIEETKQSYNIDGKFGIVMGCISDAYGNANHWSTRRQLLSIVAQEVPLYIIQQFIPDTSNAA